jgi:hypothetical protein
MGDRAIVIFYANDYNGAPEFSPAAYLHWSGSQVGALLRETAKVMAGRDGDPSYALARFMAVACAACPGNLSVGVHNGPKTMEEAKGMSHGDAGVFLVDCAKWSAEAFDGYGFRDEGRKIADLRAEPKAKRTRAKKS